MTSLNAFMRLSIIIYIYHLIISIIILLPIIFYTKLVITFLKGFNNNITETHGKELIWTIFLQAISYSRFRILISLTDIQNSSGHFIPVNLKRTI